MLTRVFASVCFLFASSLQLSTAQTLDVPYIKTPPSVVQKMLEMGKVGPNDYLIDLGSGDGRIPIAAAQQHGTAGLGVDLDPDRTAEAVQAATLAGVADRVKFRTENLFDTDIGSASVITMYLFPEINLRLRPHLLALKPGTRIVSHAFHMDDWTPDRHEIVDGNDIFSWVVPAQLQGLWRVESPSSDPFVLRVWQQFNRAQATFIGIDERSVPVNSIHVDGPNVRFTLRRPTGDQHYMGVFNDGVIRGTTKGASWQAVRID